MNDLIKRLVEAYGPSGQEEQVREIIRSEVAPYVDEVRVDALGNLFAIKRGRPGGKRVLFAAHMDEIGLIVTHIDDNGFLRFGNIGGVNAFVLLAQRVVFADGTVGAIGAEHLDDIKELRLDKLFIDIGATTAEEARQHVKVGSKAGYWRPFEVRGQRALAKSMDDRIGCAIQVQMLKELKDCPHEVVAVFTVQEEVGVRGARVAGYAAEPDLAIAFDVTATGDTPKAFRMDVALGKGAAIKVKDNSLLVPEAVVNLMVTRAKERGIAHQFEVLEYGGTDAGAIHLSKAGVPAGCISIPTRYLHTPTEEVDLTDVRACVDLALAILDGPIAL